MDESRKSTVFAGGILFLVMSLAWLTYLVAGTMARLETTPEFWDVLKSVGLFLSIWLLGYASGRRPEGKVVVWRINAGFQTYLTDKPDHAERFKEHVVAEYTHK